MSSGPQAVPQPSTSLSPSSATSPSPQTPLISRTLQPTQSQSIASTALSLSATAGQSTNPALAIAIQKHVDQLPDAFRNANARIDVDDLVNRIKVLDIQHAGRSSFRPYADRLTKFLGLLDRLLGGVSIAVQANPNISSIVVGSLKLIVDVALGFSKFFSKLIDMLDRLTGFLAPLERYAEQFDLANVGTALVDVYGDILDFCRAAGTVFLDKSGDSKDRTTLKAFLRLQWEPFESSFGEIAEHMDRHCLVLLHAAQAELLSADRYLQKHETGEK